jgi:trans-aconitate methyltransferase
MAPFTRSVTAIDINSEMIAIARQKSYPKKNVQFELADMYNYKPLIKFDGLFGGYIMSHILLQETEMFLSTINSYVQPGGSVILIDNNFVPGSSTEIAETDNEGNTWQLRTLEDGSRHRVLKNFLDEDFLKMRLAPLAKSVEFVKLKYCWLLKYEVL